MENISYSSVVGGRILHVKCFLGSNSCDIINAYQHPLHKTVLRPDPFAARAKFWTSSDAIVTQLPFHNIVLIGGDFSCELTRHAASPASYPDTLEFVELLKKHSLHTTRTHDSFPRLHAQMPDEL